MKPVLQSLAPGMCAGRGAGSICCPVAAFGIVRAGPELVASLRRSPVPAPGTPLPASFLKHADDQTVAGLAAVYQAIHNHHLAGTDFMHWGVVASPCFLGRAALAHALKRFNMEGAWGVSPHLIPHHSLHAISGTVSQALGIHGPNFGIGGGGPAVIAEALLVGATLLADRQLPGLWLVLTEHYPELIPVDPAAPGNGVHAAPAALALALALVPSAAASVGLGLQVCPHGNPAGAAGRVDWTSWATLNAVHPLADAFSVNGSPAGRWRLGAGWLQLTTLDIGAEKLR